MTVAASLHLPLLSKPSCKMTNHPSSVLSGQVSGEATVPSTRGADRAVTLGGHQLLQHSQGWTWAELAVCSWTAIIPRVWPRLQLTESSTPLSALTFKTAGSMTESLIGASYRKNPICAPPRRMQQSEQLSSPASRKAKGSSVPLLGKRKGGNPAWVLVHRMRQL